LEGTLTSGKKWASGTGTVNSGINNKFNYVYDGTTSTRNTYYFDIKLTFTPSVIVVCAYNDFYEHLSIYNKLGKTWKTDNVKTTVYAGSVNSSTSTHNHSADVKVAIGNNTYRIPVGANNLPVVWVAYE
jgi:hypothetical protein